MMASPHRETPDADTSASASLELELVRNVEAPSIARAAIRSLCEDRGVRGSHCHTVLLLVSEVISNAVLHSRGPADAAIGLTAAIDAEKVRVTVTDAGNGFTPEPRDPDRLEGGYGLYLLEKAASRWGVDEVGGTRVWFELPSQG
jgi:anti-sigma regulatory factor (Ser/Thr protein kinase)